MTDKKVINFDKLQEKLTEHGIEKYGKYLDSQIEQVLTGQVSMLELAKNMREYQEENNITEEMIIEFQKKSIEKSGLNIDIDEIDRELEKFTKMYRKDKEMLERMKQKTFFKEHKDDVRFERVAIMEVETEKNKLTIVMEGKKLIMYSKNKIDFSDEKLNEIIKGYRKCFDSDLEIITCEAANTYEYR